MGIEEEHMTSEVLAVSWKMITYVFTWYLFVKLYIWLIQFYEWILYFTIKRLENDMYHFDLIRLQISKGEHLFLIPVFLNEFRVCKEYFLWCGNEVSAMKCCLSQSWFCITCLGRNTETQRSFCSRWNSCCCS